MLNANGQAVRTRSIAHRAVWQAECQHIEDSALNDRKIAWRYWVGCPGDQLRLPTDLVNKPPVPRTDRFLHGFKSVDELIRLLYQCSVLVYMRGSPHGGHLRIVP